MRRLQTQFFISYAIFGCIGPLLSVYLMEVKGFTEREIGINQALTSIATILSPILITLLADLRVDARRILGASFLVSTCAFFLITATTGIVPALIFYTLHSLAFTPVIALQDGYYFSLARDLGPQPKADYHHIRVWGTAGFIVPSLALYFLLEWRGDLSLILWCAMACGALSALHAQWLPALRHHPDPDDGADAAPDGAPPALAMAKRLPSSEALAVLLGPRGRWFVLSLFLAFGASTAYHAFFPVYLRALVGIKSSTIGLIINLGVVLEIFYILALGRLRRRFGMRALMIAGLSCMSLRLALLAAFPSLFTALIIQLVHGLEICALYVLPVIFLNQLASDRFRNSIQGVYTMLVIGGSRIVGGLVAGHLADIDLQLLFGYGSLMAGVAVAILAVYFRPENDRI